MDDGRVGENRRGRTKKMGKNKHEMAEMYWRDGGVIPVCACCCVCVHVRGEWEARATCFLALEKQPSWQCVGGESPGPGPAEASVWPNL